MAGRSQPFSGAPTASAGASASPARPLRSEGPSSSSTPYDGGAGGSPVLKEGLRAVEEGLGGAAEGSGEGLGGATCGRLPLGAGQAAVGWSGVSVSRWLDYSHKYGHGYLLSDGTVGVLFNDSSHIVLPPDAGCYSYSGSYKGPSGKPQHTYVSHQGRQAKPQALRASQSIFI